MQENLTQEILQRIDALALKLGTTAEYLWPALVRAQVADAWVSLILAAAWSVSVLAAATCAVRFTRKVCEESVEDRMFGYLIIALLGALCLAVGCMGLGESVAKIVAPEAAALRSILPN